MVQVDLLNLSAASYSVEILGIIFHHTITFELSHFLISKFNKIKKCSFH